jgi:hypothetical protein
MTAFLRGTVHQIQSNKDRIFKASGGENFEIYFENVKKIKKCWKLSKKRTEQKISASHGVWKTPHDLEVRLV